MNRPVGPHESPGSLHKRDEEPGQVAAEDEGAYLLSCVNSIGDVGDWPLRVGDGDRGLGVRRGSQLWQEWLAWCLTTQCAWASALQQVVKLSELWVTKVSQCAQSLGPSVNTNGQG